MKREVLAGALAGLTIGLGVLSMTGAFVIVVQKAFFPVEEKPISHGVQTQGNGHVHDIDDWHDD